MAQLTKDLKAFGNKLVKLNTAIKIIKNNFNLQQYTELVNLKNSLNRISGENIISSINVPAHSNSAVDGYAINFKEYSNGNRKFNIIGNAHSDKGIDKPIEYSLNLPNKYYEDIILEHGYEILCKEYIEETHRSKCDVYIWHFIRK